MKKRLFALILAMLMLVSAFALASCGGDGDTCANGHVDADEDGKCDVCQEAMPGDEIGDDDDEPEWDPTYKIEFVYYGDVYKDETASSEDDPENIYVVKDEFGRPKRIAETKEVLLYTLDVLENTAPTEDQVKEITENNFTYGGITIIAWYTNPEKTEVCDLDALLASTLTENVKLYAELRTEVEDDGDWYAGDDITWELTSKNVLRLRGKGAMYNFTYPELAPWYFDENGNRVAITGIDVGNGITGIGSYAFYNLSIANVKDVKISETVTSIGDYAFAYSRNLKVAPLTETIKSIGRGAFEGCNAFTSIVIPDSVESIGGYAFFDCLQYKNLILGKSIKEIGEYAFGSSETTSSKPEYIYYRETEAKYDEISVGVGNYRFDEYGAYTYFLAEAYDEDVTAKAGPYWVYDRNGEPKYLSFTIRYMSAASDFPILTDYVLIGSDGKGYYSQENKKNVDGIVYRGYKFESWGNESYVNGAAFSKHATFQGNRGSHVGDTATYHFNAINTLTIKGTGSTWDFEGAGDTEYAYNKIIASQITVVRFEEGIERLGSNVLAGLTNIVYIELPSTIKEVHPSAFAACPNLAAIYYEGTSLCPGLDSLVDTSAKAYAKGSDSSAGQNGSFWALVDGNRLAWSFKDGLLTVGGDDQIPDFAPNEAPWLAYTNVKEITFANNIVRIGENAFAGMKSIEKITLHEKLTSIPRSAFKDSDYWKNADNWDGGALMANKHLLAFDKSKIPAGVSFATIPQATKFIMADAFEGCNGVKELVLPSYIEYIDPTAFAGFTDLETIYYYGTNVNAWNTLMNMPDGWLAKVLYRTSKEPSDNPEKFWHMVGRVPTPWG